MVSNRNFKSWLPICCLAPQHIFQPLHFCRRFSLPLLIIVSSSSRVHWAIENLDPPSLTPGDAVVPLFAVSGDEIISWRGEMLFANLYELKFRIWLWEEYDKFDRIYRVHRFVRFSSNFTKTFQELWKRMCREIVIFEIFVPWCSFTQHDSQIFSYSNFRCWWSCLKVHPSDHEWPPFVVTRGHVCVLLDMVDADI